MINEPKTSPTSHSPPSRGERLLVIALITAVFIFLLVRLIQSRGQFPEDASTFSLRIVELVFIAAFALWMAAPLLRRTSSPNDSFPS